jgi:hypothetical protein
MAFSYDPSALATPLNHLRFLVQDTVSPNHFLQDEEINFISSQETNIHRAAARLCRTLAAKFAQMPGYEDKQKFNPESKAETYLKLAKDFDKKADDVDETIKTSTGGDLRLPALPCGKITFTRDLHFSK